MKTAEQNRVENLNVLVKEYGGTFAFADHINKDRSQVSQWINQSINPKTGKRRNISAISCRLIEVACNKQRGWMDVSHTSTKIEQEHADYLNIERIPMGMRRIPLINHVQAGEMTEAVDPYAVGAAADWLLVAEDYSENTFALEVKGESMLPDFKEGDRIIIDPAIEPLPGDYVIAINGENEATFKQYRPRGLNERGEMVFELVPLNENYPKIKSNISPTRIIGTMVEHHRYRKR